MSFRGFVADLKKLNPHRMALPMLEEVFGLTVVKTTDLNNLKLKIEKLEKENEHLMMTHYSAEAARTIHEEIRKLLNCPPGNNIVEAIKKLRNQK